ncbi:MAG: hypothetical protein DHS20C17_00190 [Cyclobacteriaceae bacterium]|nr:MAG: hypothetical protein DHS20C17_00190 [Cyclobacteriaceae bacterium]
MFELVKKWCFLVILLVFSLQTISQDNYVKYTSQPNYHIWFNHESHQNASSVKFQKELDNFVVQLKKKQHRYNELTFLRFLYFKVHRKYLKRYQTPSTLSDLYSNQRYDCLTGTALYSMIFHKLGIQHNIVETTFHVYLTLNADGKNVILESTSPLDGFITDPELAQETITSYQQEGYQQEGNQNSWSGQDYYKPTDQVNQIITLTELAGLQYFNQAVAAYNLKDLESAFDQMSKALSYYPSDRLKQMMVIMLNTISSNSSRYPHLEQDAYARFGHLKQVPIANNSVK